MAVNPKHLYGEKIVKHLILQNSNSMYCDQMYYRAYIVKDNYSVYCLDSRT